MLFSLSLFFFSFRLYKVGRQVINSNTLFWPKTSMHDVGKPWHWALWGVTTNLQPQRSVIFIVMYKQSCTILLSFYLLPFTVVSEHIGDDEHFPVFSFMYTLTLNFWCRSCVPNSLSTLRLFIWNYLFKPVFIEKFSDMTQSFKGTATCRFLICCLHLLCCCGRRVASCYVPVGCSEHSYSSWHECAVPFKNQQSCCERNCDHCLRWWF